MTPATGPVVAATGVSAGIGGSERLLQQELCELFCGLVEAEAFAGSVVELVGDVVEVDRSAPSTR
jgi:hypothetical protein